MFSKHVYLCTTCMFSAHQGQERMPGPQKMELQVFWFTMYVLRMDHGSEWEWPHIHIWVLALQLVNYLGRIRRHGLVGGGMSPEVGFQLALCLTRADKMWTPSYCFSTTPVCPLPCFLPWWSWSPSETYSNSSKIVLITAFCMAIEN